MSGIFILEHSEWVKKLTHIATNFEKFKCKEIRFGVDQSGLYYIEFINA